MKNKNERTTAVCFNGYFRIFLRKIRCWMECFVIFVMAWCWCNATESKPQNVAHNIFSELPHNASLLFFRKKINEIYKWKILRDNGKLKPNFVKNLQRQFSDFCNIKTILSRKNLGKPKPNFVETFKDNSRILAI